jgi:PAS domain S-box-containing protein
LRATFEQAAVGIAHVAPDGHWLRVNDRLCAITGYSRDELLARTFQDITHPDDLEADLELVRQMLAGERERYSMEKRYIRKNGAPVWINLSVALVRASGGAPEYFVSVVEDIDERKRLERQTREALDAVFDIARSLVEAPYDESESDRLALDHAIAELARRLFPVRYASIFTVRPNTDLLEMRAVAGYTRAQEVLLRQRNVGLSLSERIPDAALRQRLVAGEVVVIDLTVPRYAAQRRLYGSTVGVLAPLRIGERFIGILGLNPEENVVLSERELALAVGAARMAALVIERERLLREREEAQASALALRQVNERMDDFMSLAGHELKNPLTAMSAAIQLAVRQLRQTAGDEGSVGHVVEAGAVIAAFERAQRQAVRMQRLIDDLLDAARARTGKLELRMAPCDLGAIVRECTDDQRAEHANRTLTLTLPEHPVPILADAERIGQVVTNYLTNALKYSAEDRPVAVQLDVREEADGGVARVGVRDEGPGLTPEQQAHLWERGYRAPGIEVRSGTGVGLGLGLYLSRVIIAEHAGTVGVESEVGEEDHGSTFWFTLPLAQ